MAKSRKIDWVALAAIAGPVMGIAGGLLVTGWISEKKLADKPYVDERFVEGKRYTDEKSANVLREAIEHSDTNRREMLLKMEQMNTDYKSSTATLTNKIDNVLDLVKGMRDDWHPRNHK